MVTWRKRRYPLILVILSLTSIAIFIWTTGLTILSKQQPTAKNGVLDLTKWNLQKDGPIQLDGQWEFYWKQLLTLSDFKKNNRKIKFSGYQNVPDVWNHYNVNGTKPSGMGYGTYCLNVKLPKGQKSLGLKLLTMSTSYKLMLDNKQIASSGVVGKSQKTAAPQYKTQAVSISPSSNEFKIIIQVSNYTYSRGGIWRSIILGTDQKMRILTENSARREMFVFGVMIIMLCYHFSLYWIQKRNKSMIYAMLGLLFIALRILVTGEYYITKLFPNIPFFLIIFLEYTTIYWAPIVWVLFVGELFPNEFPRRTLRVFTSAAIIFTVIAAITPIFIYTNLLMWVELYTVAMFIYTFIKVIKAYLRKRSDAPILLFCVILILCTYIFDTLFFWDIFTEGFGNSLMIAVTITVLLQAYIIAVRYSRAFDEAEEYSHRMEYLNQLKDEFLANTSHELRTPLNGIISITESILHDKVQKLSPHIENRLNIVLQMGQRLSFLIKDILDFSRMKNNKLILEKNTFELFALIDNIFNELELKASDKNITFDRVSEEKSIYITADKYRIIQVLYNLLDNAIKFTNDGGLIIVKLIKKHNKVFISIIDNGIGIPENKLARIFEPFERVELSDTSRYPGIGLGLNISRSIVQAHGGDISVKSKLNEGSEFTVVLPLIIEDNSSYATAQDDAIYRQQVSLESQNALFMKGNKKGCIAIIDDQYSNIVGTAGILNAEGYTVKGFTNPKEGLMEILLFRNFDIAVVDLMMPRISGYDICKKIREQFSIFELPILVLTAKTGNSTIHSLNVGANDILHKPFEREELLARINTLIHLKDSTEQAICNEVAMLQAQINPHFLHNAMNAIAACCYEDGEKAYDAITSLSEYLQYSYDLSPEAKEITLKKEIELIKAYLSVEKLRFGDKLNYEIQFEHPERIKLPPFMIQPLVENAVRHGITKNEGNGFIKISGRIEDDHYTIVIEDNGHGISAERMHEILSEKKSKNVGIGLSNVRKRLKKRYGTDLNINSKIGEGTRVSFSIKIGGLWND